ncbi:unnamed protein product [Rotaria magnacalcarata]|uniref:ATP-grasp domain-containing protein n=2 Tax=Rotaria magnacalcarata TaxID=392030 RepID=A0A820ANP6_9BILA|nr:unnamed protein product [Rotaria magnacalcarata]CAF4180299.1 unnamed protein product [Rotaria magnacalcarata]
MLTFYNENSIIMGNGQTGGEKKADGQHQEDVTIKKTLQLGEFNRRKSNENLIFFAGTDKARVITEILEERGWSRTRDHSITNFTMKWCLANQVDWSQFQEGKQLINNIPGQLAFSDKINLWYTIKDYLHNRRTSDGNHIQNFLPMTFVLDDEREVGEFLRSYKKHNRTWICKPRYSYAGRGIFVISVNSDLNAIFKFQIGNGNRIQYQPRLPGYLMQEYISRPLLIKGRKFDIRVHWLVAWTKPLLVFYNHNASAVRLSLNLYREFDFDRATHLTNLSVQENHYRYSFSQEATGMTISQLNHYFNRCFRPFHPKMCQDWVMTVMQERMQTIIRHVVRASKHKLAREAGQFGLFGCDFLLDENFRIWLLEINDNPGVGWGNPRLNTTTKPLFEETLDIVFECFEKFKNNESLLPIQCLKNYKLIYNEDDDVDRLLRDDNQLFSDRLSIRYAIKDILARPSFHRTLIQTNTSRTIVNQVVDNNNNNVILPLDIMTDSNSSVGDIIPFRSTNADGILTSSSVIGTTSVNLHMSTITPDTDATIEPLKHEDDIALEHLMKSKKLEKKSKTKPLISTSTTSMNRVNIKANKISVKRNISTSNTIYMQRKKRLDLTPIIIDKKCYVHRNGIIPISTETTKKEDNIPNNEVIRPAELQNDIENQENQSVITSITSIIPLKFSS